MISVLLPTYNSTEYIAEAIWSILNQTFQDFELLIIDDGSTDRTEVIVENFNDKRITYVKKKHTGLADTLNYGVKLAKYNWIARMDSDDISHPQRLEKQMKILENDPSVDWVSSWYSTFKKNQCSIIKLPEFTKDIQNGLVLSSSVCFAGSIFKKNIIIENGGFEGDIFEDYRFLLKIKNNCIFYNIQEVLYYQRKRKNSLSRGNFEEIKEIHYNIQEPYFKNLQKEFYLKNEDEENYFKGWREFLYGNKKLSRVYWLQMGFNIILYPKVIIGIILSLFPKKSFFYLRKIGFKLVLFYCPFISINDRREFRKIMRHINLIKNYAYKK